DAEESSHHPVPGKMQSGWKPQAAGSEIRDRKPDPRQRGVRGREESSVRIIPMRPPEIDRKEHNRDNGRRASQQCLKRVPSENNLFKGSGKNEQHERGDDLRRDNSDAGPINPPPSMPDQIETQLRASANDL